MITEMDRTTQEAGSERLCNPHDHLKSISPPPRKTLDSGSNSSDEDGSAGRSWLEAQTKEGRRDHSRKRSNPEETVQKRHENKHESSQLSDGDDRHKSNTAERMRAVAMKKGTAVEMQWLAMAKLTWRPFAQSTIAQG